MGFWDALEIFLLLVFFLGFLGAAISSLRPSSKSLSWLIDIVVAATCGAIAASFGYHIIMHFTK
jgi:hypothetical protein